MPPEISARVSLTLLLPQHMTLEYYFTILQNRLFLHSLFISFLKTSIASLGSVTLTSMMAYGISKSNIKGMKTMNFIMIFLYFFSGGLIPSYLLYLSLHLTGTLWVMIIPNLIYIGNFILMRNYFAYSVSIELEDAATIDGANEFIMFFKIIIPVSMPMFAAILLFDAVGNWNDWVSYLYFVNKTEYMPFVVVLQSILNSPNTFMSGNGIGTVRPLPPDGLIKATIIIAIAPIMCVYPFLQKHFAKGIMIGAVKG
jgi:ABC-type sugar transport system, permease component